MLYFHLISFDCDTIFSIFVTFLSHLYIVSHCAYCAYCAIVAIVTLPGDLSDLHRAAAGARGSRGPRESIKIARPLGRCISWIFHESYLKYIWSISYLYNLYNLQRHIWRDISTKTLDDFSRFCSSRWQNGGSKPGCATREGRPLGRGRRSQGSADISWSLRTLRRMRNSNSETLWERPIWTCQQYASK